MEKAIQIAYDSSFELKCELAKKAGFKSISVNFYGMLGKDESDWSKAVDDIGRILDKTGIECIQIHPYYYDLLLSSEIEKPECEYAIEQAIIAGARLGSKWTAIHPRTSINSGYRTSVSLEDNKKMLSRYLECAIKHGTGVAAENLPILRGLCPLCRSIRRITRI